MIKIVGLGPGDLSLISYGAIEALKNSDKVFLRTEKHPVVKDLKKLTKFESLDHFYNENDDFDDVYRKISEFIVEEGKSEDVVYAVPGHPRVAEKTVDMIEKLAKENNIDVDVVASMSFVDAMFEALAFDPSNGFRLVDAFEMQTSYIDTDINLIVTQVYDEFIASEVKLYLMDRYDDEQEVYIVRGAGIKGEEFIKKVRLCELDWAENEFDYLTSLYVPRVENKKYNTVHDLELIMDKLRAPDGCDWDKKQTHESLKNSVIEEAYELYNAIENDDIDEMIEELGDVLLQVIFHCQIGKEEGMFDLGEVANGICTKLITRHPHIFGDANINRDEFEKTWEEIKKKEKGESTITEGIKRIPVYLPALMKAEKVQHKAALVGFDWDDIYDVFSKVEEEYEEVREAYELDFAGFVAEKYPEKFAEMTKKVDITDELGNKLDVLEKIKEENLELLDEYHTLKIQYIKEELGDLLFSIVNLARFLDVDTTEALNGTIDKFVNRFGFVEEKVIESGKTFDEMSLEEMDKFWDQAKELEI